MRLYSGLGCSLYSSSELAAVSLESPSRRPQARARRGKKISSRIRPRRVASDAWWVIVSPFEISALTCVFVVSLVKTVHYACASCRVPPNTGATELSEPIFPLCQPRNTQCHSTLSIILNCLHCSVADCPCCYELTTIRLHHPFPTSRSRSIFLDARCIDVPLDKIRTLFHRQEPP
jgi:hypothetical protein